MHGKSSWSRPTRGTELADGTPATAQDFLRFLANHRLLDVEGRPQWRTVVGGGRVPGVLDRPSEVCYLPLEPGELGCRLAGGRNTVQRAEADYGRDESFQREYAASAKDEESWRKFRAEWLDVSEAEYQRKVRARSAK